MERLIGKTIDLDMKSLAIYSIVLPIFLLCISCHRKITPKPGLYPFRGGYINEKAQYVIQPQYTITKKFSEGLAAVRTKKEGLFGYINQEGKMVISPSFYSAQKFSKGYALVFSPQKKGFPVYQIIDASGAVVSKLSPNFTECKLNVKYITCRQNISQDYLFGASEVLFTRQGKKTPYDRVTVSPQGCGFYWQNDKVSKIESNGKSTILQNIKYIADFQDGMAKFKQNDRYGFFDATCQIKIPATLANARSFQGGVANVKRKSKWIYIDKQGKEKFSYPNKGYIDFSKYGYAKILPNFEKRQYGIIDSNGQYIIDPKYDSIEILPSKYAIVMKHHEGKYRFGLVTPSGKFKLPLEYDRIIPMGWSEIPLKYHKVMSYKDIPFLIVQKGYKEEIFDIYGNLYPSKTRSLQTRWVILKTGIYMRDSVGILGNEIKFIQEGEEVELLSEFGEEMIMAGVKGKWSQVLYQGESAWVFGGFLSKEKVAVPMESNCYQYKEENFPEKFNGNVCINCTQGKIGTISFTRDGDVYHIEGDPRTYGGTTSYLGYWRKTEKKLIVEGYGNIIWGKAPYHPCYYACHPINYARDCLPCHEKLLSTYGKTSGLNYFKYEFWMRGQELYGRLQGQDVHPIKGKKSIPFEIGFEEEKMSPCIKRELNDDLKLIAPRQGF
ncbi:MAG: WG repeat-containing protein [Spirochaetota bacterium]